MHFEAFKYCTFCTDNMHLYSQQGIQKRQRRESDTLQSVLITYRLSYSWRMNPFETSKTFRFLLKHSSIFFFDFISYKKMQQIIVNYISYISMIVKIFAGETF